MEAEPSSHSRAAPDTTTLLQVRKLVPRADQMLQEELTRQQMNERPAVCSPGQRHLAWIQGKWR